MRVETQARAPGGECTKSTQLRYPAQRVAGLLAFASVLASAWALVCTTATAENPAKTESPSEAELNLATYDAVGQIVLDTHWDPTLGGIDWQAFRDEFRPSLEAAADRDVIRQAATKLLSKLDQSHFGLIPAEFYEKNGDEASESGWTGIEFRLLAGAPIITAVEPNSPASLAGLSPGGEIVAIGEQSIEEVTDLSAAGEIPADVIEQAVYEKIASKLSGELGETVKLTLKAVDGGEKTVEMTAVAVPGKVTQFGNLPPMTVQLETKMLDDAVGYIRFNLFMDPARLLEQIGEFVSNNQDAKGMIIDLRGNLGGLGAMAMGLAGWFAIEEQQSLGQMQTRQGNLNFVYFRRPKSFRGPLAILVDERSMSTAEIFPGGLQAHGRCRIFGRPTPGMALPSIVEILPNGDRFLHAFANFVLPEGEALEGVGVTPDELVVLDRQLLSAGIDQDVQAAKRWLLQAADAE